MIILVDGPSCSGKTNTAQQLMSRLMIPYYSMDHLKMGLYRTNYLNTSMENEKVSNFLYPICREMVLTAMENNQHFILEGLYFHKQWVPFIKETIGVYYFCILFSENYIKENWHCILDNRSIIEKRLEPEERTIDEFIMDHLMKKKFCQDNQLNYVEIEQNYDLELTNFLDELIKKWDE